MMNLNNNYSLIQEFQEFNKNNLEDNSGPAHVTNIDLETSSGKLSNIIDNVLDSTPYSDLLSQNIIL